MLYAIACLVIAFQSPVELRSALDALRKGHPGEPAFEAALPQLPALLASKSSTFVSGAAYLAGKHGRKECHAALLDALEHENTVSTDTSREPTGVLLDALIRLDLAAPFEIVLAKPEPKFAAHMYLALALEPDAARRAVGLARYLDLGFTVTAAHWAAVYRLTAARDPRAARWLIAGVPWMSRFGVCDDETEQYFGVMGEGGIWSTSHEIWPPRIDYRITLPDGDQPLDAITFKRAEYTRSGPGPSSLPFSEIIVARARALEHLLGGTSQLDLEHVTQFVVYADDASLGPALDEHVGQLRERIRSAAERLASLKLLGDTEPLLTSLAFRIEVQDLRREPNAAIIWPPSTPTLELVVR